MRNRADLGQVSDYQLPAVIARNARIVRKGLLIKLMHGAGRIPFAEEIAAAYFCVLDPATPKSVKAILLAGLAYFVLPFEFVPALFLALGLASDAAVVLGVVRTVSRHIKPQHYRQARAALGIADPVE